jgi:signal transduction histidine kinase
MGLPLARCPACVRQAFNHTRCFIRDDTGRRVREARVEALLKETDRSLKLLDAFVSRTLHLVKTPCHVVQQSLGLLASNMRALVGRMPKAEAAFFAETDALLEASMKQLSDVADLINDASDVMRFEQGAVLQTVPVPLPLKVIGRSAVDHVKDLAKPRVRVAFEFEKGPSVASLDAKILHRALDQLLKNAAEATPEGGSITLKVRRVWDARARERARERAKPGPILPLSRATTLPACAPLCPK